MLGHTDKRSNDGVEAFNGPGQCLTTEIFKYDTQISHSIRL